MEFHHIDLQFVRIRPSLKQEDGLILVEKMISTCAIDNEDEEKKI
jgi:hypothetical protein